MERYDEYMCPAVAQNKAESSRLEPHSSSSGGGKVQGQGQGEKMFLAETEKQL